MSKYTEAAAKFMADLNAHPYLNRVTVRPGAAPSGSIVTVYGEFDPGDRNGFIFCDGDAYSILGHMEMTYPGTVWGTDGASIGGHVALTSGHFRLSKSGIGKRYATALAKLVDSNMAGAL